MEESSLIGDGAVLDLAACAREPIHVPGTIQPHGILLALEGPSFLLRQASANASRLLGRAVEAALGQPIGTMLPTLERDLGRQFESSLSQIEARPSPAVYLGRFAFEPGQGDAFDVLAHHSGNALILELEEAAEPAPDPFGGLYPLASACMAELQAAQGLPELGTIAARHVRAISGFDRVLIYRFDSEWNGTVVAEDRNDALPSYLDLRFPASDIPAQARELYRLNPQRLIPNADYRPVPMVPPRDPLTGQPLDLSFSVLRSVSPVHVEYMKNMGTRASMSFSLLHQGRLWGLISCHNAEPRRIPAPLRAACEFVARIAATQIGAHEQSARAAYRLHLKEIESLLLAQMAAEESFAQGLAKDPEPLLALANAQGAAIVQEERCILVGRTPPEHAVRQLANHLATRAKDEVFSTDCLSRVVEGGEDHKEEASGVLGIPISELHPSYVLWFRPEIIRTVAWGGDPRKSVEHIAGNARLHPRKSFEAWKETVRLRSLPWQDEEVEAVKDLRKAVVGIVLRKAEEMAALAEELTRSNKELEAFSYSISHDLRAPFRHVVGYAELLREFDGPKLSERGQRYVDTIIESAHSAGRLVDELLNFSRMGRMQIQPIPIDMDLLVAETRRRLEPDIQGRNIEWRVAPLPPAQADPMMMRLVLENLVSNAIKYTRPRDRAVIEIGAMQERGETVYFVRDNGVGFDMAYADKLFGVFQRLHRVEEFEGTGIGLANVRRIMERHHGRVWAEAGVDEGATFFFALPHFGSRAA